MDNVCSCQRCSFEGKSDENMFQIEIRLATKLSCNTSQNRSKTKSGTFELMQNKGGAKFRVTRSVAANKNFVSFRRSKS